MARVESLTTAGITAAIDAAKVTIENGVAAGYVPSSGASTISGAKNFTTVPTVNGTAIGGMVVLLLTATDPIPEGTPANTIIARTP